MARPFMFGALCYRAHPLKHSLAESTFVSRVQKREKIFVSRKIRYQSHSLAEVSLYLATSISILALAQLQLVKPRTQTTYPNYVPKPRTQKVLNFLMEHTTYRRRGSSVGKATGYGLDGPVRGSNSCGDAIFRTCSDRPCGPPSILYNKYHVFPGGKKRPGRESDPSPPSNTAVKKE
jgi:hypothetical protein